MLLNEQHNRNHGQPRQVGGIVDRLLASLGLAEKHHGWDVVRRWPDIVGEHYARNSEAFRYADGIIYVAVENASWRQTMSMDREKILNIIHSHPHGRVIKDIHLVRAKKGS